MRVYIYIDRYTHVPIVSLVPLIFAYTNPSSFGPSALRPRAAGAATAACQKAELRVGQAPIHADVPPGRVNGGNGRGKDNRPGGWVDLGPK